MAPDKVYGQWSQNIRVHHFAGGQASVKIKQVKMGIEMDSVVWCVFLSGGKLHFWGTYSRAESVTLNLTEVVWSLLVL